MRQSQLQELTHSKQVLKTTSETAEPGQIINRHAIGVLEIIKKIGKRAASCPEESMLSELDILKLEKIATTTAQVLSHSNLFANLGKKVSFKIVQLIDVSFHRL